MKRLLVLALLAVPALLVAAACARAEPITWSFAWSASPGVVTSNDGSLGKVTFLPHAGGPLNGSWHGLLASNLVAAAPATGPATFTSPGYGPTLPPPALPSPPSSDPASPGARSGHPGPRHSP